MTNNSSAQHFAEQDQAAAVLQDAAEPLTITTTARTLAPETPAYITVTEAAGALATRPWPVAELIEAGELRAVRYGSLLLVSRYDVEQLGGVIA